jgi:hypothetical protein
MKRPAEITQSAASAVIGAALIVYGAVQGGIDVTKLSSPAVQGAIVLLLGQLAAVRTWIVARRQRAGQLASAHDGTVHPTG